jgi:phage gpG-like protein
MAITVTENLSQPLKDGRFSDKTLADIVLRAGDIAVRESKLNISERASALYPPWKNPKYKGNKLLYLTGTLHKSIYRGLAEGVGNGKASATYGSLVEYAARQYFGGGGILARPYLDMIPESSQMIVDYCQEQFTGALENV